MRRNKRTPPPPAPSRREMTTLPRSPTFGSTIMDGVAFGTGSSIAHRAMDAIMGVRRMEVATAPVPEITSDNKDICKSLSEKYLQCVRENASSCLELHQLLNEYKCNLNNKLN